MERNRRKKNKYVRPFSNEWKRMKKYNVMKLTVEISQIILENLLHEFQFCYDENYQSNKTVIKSSMNCVGKKNWRENNTIQIRFLKINQSVNDTACMFEWLEQCGHCFCAYIGT